VRIEHHPTVIDEDLPGIYSYISRDNPDAAERLLSAIAQTFELLSANPDCGFAYRTQSTKFNAVRMIPVTDFNQYLVFYRIADDAVRILYVVHGARHLPRLFKWERRD
jgi:plasmid stabilization system protein ParE